jgi:predicted phosphodiesterase
MSSNLLMLPSLTQPDLPIFYQGETDRTPEVVNTRRTLLLYDTHIPYQASLPISVALTAGKAAKVDTVIFGGDTTDFYQGSDFTKDPRRRSISAEVDKTISFLRDVRSVFKKESIYFMEGNHEYRIKNYIRNRAKELLGLHGTDLESMLCLKDLGIKLVQDKRRVLIGNLNVLHGHEYPNIGSGINPARSMFLKAKAPTIFGHCHRKSEHNEVTLDGKSVACWSVGCLCNLSPEYLPYNNWVWGFAIVETDSQGHYTVHNKFISKEGKVY